MLTRQEIFNLIDSERKHQEQKWGNVQDDTTNHPNDWVTYISHHSTKWFPGGFSPYNAITVEAFRQSMIKTAALAVAAIESLDRQVAINGKAFYQE